MAEVAIKPAVLLTGSYEGESDADLLFTADLLTHKFSDDLGGPCVFCGHGPYEYVHNGLGYEPVAATCCENGVAYYQYRDPEISRIAHKLEEAISVRVEASRMIEELVRRVYDHMTAEEGQEIRAAIKAGWENQP